MKKILYIGNNLTKSTKYYSSMELLYTKLKYNGYIVYISSNKQCKVLRILDMCFAIIKHKDIVDYILIDTFSTSNFYFALVTSQIARLLKLKYIPILRGGNLPYRLDNNKWFSKLIFNHSYKNIAPSGYLKYEFEKRGYPTVFIPNIIEIVQYPFKERENIAPHLLYVRAFDKIYNPTMAIHVLHQLKQKYPEAKLCMIGPFKDDSINEVRTLINKLHLYKNVEITGVLSKEEWHKKAAFYDVFINTTNFDNTPVSVMEAMALGLVVVSTNAGGLPYLINNNEDGILVNKGDIKAMSKAIIDLMREPKKTLQMAQKAREKVEKFDWKFVKKQWNTILNV